MDEVVTPDLAAIIYEQVRNYVVTRGRNRGAMNPVTGSDPVHEEAVRKRIAAALPPPVETDAMKARKEAETETKPAEESSSSQEESNATTSSSSQDSEPTNQFHTPPTTTTTHTNGKDRAASHSAVPQVGSTDTTEIDIELAKLEEAYAHQVLYIIGKEEMHVKKTGILRKVLLEIFLWIRSNTRTKIANLRVPTDRVIEVGFVKDV